MDGYYVKTPHKHKFIDAGYMNHGCDLPATDKETIASRLEEWRKK